MCNGWMLLLFLICVLHHVHSKYWWSFKRRHTLLVCFISFPVTLCLKAGKKLWKELELSEVVSDVMVMLELYWEVISEVWLFLKRRFLTTEIHIMYIEPYEVRQKRVMRSNVTNTGKKPVVHIEMILCCGRGWAWFRSLLIGSPYLVIRQLLIRSGNVELNPGPLEHGRPSCMI